MTSNHETAPKLQVHGDLQQGQKLHHLLEFTGIFEFNGTSVLQEVGESLTEINALLCMRGYGVILIL